MTVATFVKNCKSERGAADKYGFYINGRSTGRTDYFRKCSAPNDNREVLNFTMTEYTDGSIHVDIMTA